MSTRRPCPICNAKLDSDSGSDSRGKRKDEGFGDEDFGTGGTRSMKVGR